MKCSRCGAEMKIKNVKVGTDIYGNPIYNKYAYCYNCKIKRKLEQSKSSSVSNRSHTAKRAKKHRKKRLLITLIFLILLAITVGTGFFIQKNKAEVARKEKEKALITESRKTRISSKAFSKLETGMTLQEVLDIIGNSGNKLVQTTSDDSVMERYQWIADSRNGSVLLTFKDEKLISISQVDMTSDSTSFSTDSINNIKTGMSYKEVINTLGSDGSLISETSMDGVTTQIYTWRDRDSSITITTVFRDDVLLSIHTNSKK